MTQNKTLTDNEAFEKWFDANRELYDDNSTYDLMQIAWVAAKQESAREIAELRQKIAVFEDGFESHIAMDKALRQVDANTINELQAQVNQLREALTSIAVYNGGLQDSFSQIIEDTCNSALKSKK